MNIKVLALGVAALALTVACNNNKTAEEPVDTIIEDTVVIDSMVEDTTLVEAVVEEVENVTKTAKKATTPKVDEKKAIQKAIAEETGVKTSDKEVKDGKKLQTATTKHINPAADEMSDKEVKGKKLQKAPAAK